MQVPHRGKMNTQNLCSSRELPLVHKTLGSGPVSQMESAYVDQAFKKTVGKKTLCFLLHLYILPSDMCCFDQ